ncbi:MAG TPA: TonB-dependent receptor [Cytophagaceae bacterium]|jgi:Fe(3+) dicitrate transport protein|nr:TonB-dependent receptor [Cytophagaceae bacterium]
MKKNIGLLLPFSFIRVFSILLFLLTLNSTFSTAQTPSENGEIKGKISGTGGKLLDSVSVRIKDTDFFTSTDQHGNFVFKNVPAGNYIINAENINYASQDINVQVKSGEVTTVEIPFTDALNQMGEVVVIGTRSKNGIGNLPETLGTVIYAGKKNEVLILDSLDANKAQNNPRQILGRIPGMNFSETEGGGFPSNGFGLRGLNPTQSVEMNTRQNGYNITSDIYGYNESYYNPAMEAVQRIEVVRGAASLQFGPQFGGTVNFVMKEGPKNKPFEYIMQQTGGSYGLFNSFHSVGGTVKKVSYYAYAQYKNSQGWRPNSGFSSLTGYAKIDYQATDKLKVGLEYTILRNRIQMPGGLTDQEFNEDSRQSFRARNWLNSPWNIITGTLEYKLSPSTTVSVKSAYLISERNLVWKNEDGGPEQADSISPVTNSYVQREVQREAFSSSTTEARILSNYTFLGMKNSIAGGIRFFYGKMKRQGGGPGSTGSDFDLTLYGGDYEYSLDFTTTNFAPFIEHIFRISPKWSITPGFRYEFINSTINGYITDTGNGDVRVNSNNSRNRFIALGGVGSQYKITKTTNIYANWSQAYRPMDYSSLTPIGVTSKIDPNMKDAYGYNADLGWRGTIGNFLNFDLGVFYLQYNRRIGLVTLTDPNTGNPYTLRTNTGNSESKGIETYVEINPLKIFTENPKIGNISLFNSFAYIDARYTSGNADNGLSIVGNRVEYAPQTINRLGVTYGIKGFSITYQLSSTGMSYGDANNTVYSSDALIGVIPAYTVMDVSATYKIRNYNIKAGVNNIADSRYFTKRTDEYPGPGIIPAQGRSFYVSLGAKF